MSLNRIIWLGLVASSAAMILAAAPATAQPAQKPNIVVIMGDDIGMWNIGAYHRGLMAGRTPNLDQIAAEGMLFTDYYAEASCTAGRANFITGELPIRTGMTTVGQAGAAIGIPAQAVTIATALKGRKVLVGCTDPRIPDDGHGSGVSGLLSPVMYRRARAAICAATCHELLSHGKPICQIVPVCRAKAACHRGTHAPMRL
jgi:Sulfatase